MILISHRGNINGRIEDFENRPDYIEDAVRLGYDVEIDVWVIDGDLFLGHDAADHKIHMNWISSIADKLWIHCKNVDAISFLNKSNYDLNYFWHQQDTVTLTSKKFIWAYPSKEPVKNSIAVMPEIYSNNLKDCIGLCSDYVSNYLIWKK